MLFLVMGIVFIASCKKDDNGGVQVTPPNKLSDQIVEEDAEIKAFLTTHFYNYEEFNAPPAGFDYRIVIDTIAGDNAAKETLMSQMSIKEVTVESSQLGIDGDESIVHNIYYLSARDGAGVSPTFADSTYVRYKGSLLNGDVFDGATEVPTWFNLVASVRGFSSGLPFMKQGDGVIDNNDGTFEVENYGVGMIVFSFCSRLL